MQHKLAFIGYGGMAGWHQFVIRDRVKSIKIKGVFDVREEALKKAEDEGLKAYKSLDELLADKTIDIVIIATPNNFHKDLAIAALRSGKNVICEKPVTMNAGELEEIIAVQKETGKLFSVHQNRRWDKDFRIIKKIIESDVVGRPYFIESRVEGSRQYFHGWRDCKMNGGGMLLDWGVHLIDQIMWLIPQKVVSVYAELVSIYSKEVDDNGKIVIKFEDGLSAHIDLLMNSFVNMTKFRLLAFDGTAVIENWDCDGKIVKLLNDKKPIWDEKIVYTAAGPTRSMAPRLPETIKEIKLPNVKTDAADYYRNFIAVLDKGDELIVKPEESLRVMKVIDLAFQSHADGRSISCEI